MIGRMRVGRFANRAEALDFLVEKYSTKKFQARYSINDRETSRVAFTFHRDFGKKKIGEVTYVGNGEDISAAIVDLFTQLGDSVEEETTNA